MLVDITAGVLLSWVLVRFFDILFGKLGFEVAASDPGAGQRQLLLPRESEQETRVLHQLLPLAVAVPLLVPHRGGGKSQLSRPRR